MASSIMFKILNRNNCVIAKDFKSSLEANKYAKLKGWIKIRIVKQ